MNEMSNENFSIEIKTEEPVQAAEEIPAKVAPKPKKGKKSQA